MRDLTQHLTTRADDSHAAPPQQPRREVLSPERSTAVQIQVRFFALYRIKPHAPPLVRAPVNSFEFQPCDRTPQAGHLSVSYGTSGIDTRHTKCPTFTAWTTRVSNPVCYPRFRSPASVVVQKVAFATGVPPNTYAFHRYTGNSTFLSHTQARQFWSQFHG